MSSLRRGLTRAASLVLGVTMLTAAMTGAAQADQSDRTTRSSAIASLPANPVAILATGGYVNAAVGGWFDGLVYVDPNLPWRPSTNLWVPQADVWTGPGNLTYQQIRFKDKCLSHAPVASSVEGMLVIEPCVYSNNSQWWAVDHKHAYTPPCPPEHWPFCPPAVYVDLLVPWDAPDRAATVEGGIFVLRPRIGSLGSSAQRLTIAAIPKFE